MFPAQALAEEMLRRGWRVRLSTDVRGARYTQGFPKEIEIEVVRLLHFRVVVFWQNWLPLS